MNRRQRFVPGLAPYQVPVPCPCMPVCRGGRSHILSTRFVSFFFCFFLVCVYVYTAFLVKNIFFSSLACSQNIACLYVYLCFVWGGEKRSAWAFFLGATHAVCLCLGCAVFFPPTGLCWPELLPI